MLFRFHRRTRRRHVNLARVAVVSSLGVAMMAGAAHAAVTAPYKFADGFKIGQPSSLARFTPTALSASVGAGVLANSTDVTYSNVWQSTDATTTAIVGGARLSLLLKDRYSPSSFSWTVTSNVASSTLARNLNGTVDMTSPYGFVSARAAVPVVNTNYGNVVPSRWSVSGNTLTLTVDHSDPAWTYPIYVSLDFTQPNDSTITNPIGYDCGSGFFNRDEAYKFGIDAGLTTTEATQFATEPCMQTASYPDGGVVIADAGTDTTVVAGPAGAAPCKVVKKKIKLVTNITRFNRNVEMASYNMSTYFCYDGSRVWRKGFYNEPPAVAAVTDIQYTGIGLGYQVEYIGTASGPPLSGWQSWNNLDRGSAFTTLTTNWKGGFPIIKWAWPEAASVTRTQTVYANGTSS